MSHEITDQDKVISARNQTPWHGLGEIAPSFEISDLYRIMDWTVKKVPLITVQGDNTNGFATVRMNHDETNRIVLSTTLSNHYSILQNRELIEVVQPFVEQGCMIETAGTLKQGQKVWILLRLSSNIFVTNEDEIKSFILVSNDHTGKNSARIGTVAIRVVCNNTLTMAHNDDKGKLVKVLHKGNVKDNMDFVASTIDHFNGQFKIYGQQLSDMQNVPLTFEGLKAYAMECLKAQLTEENTEKTINKIISIHNNELVSAQGTVYGAYQAVNGFINHNKDTNDNTKLNSLIYGQKRMLDQKAFNLALDFIS